MKTSNKFQYTAPAKDIVVFHNKNEKPYIAYPHLHSQYEIYYNISGARGFMLNGEFYKCVEHDLILVPKIQAHKAIVGKNTPYERCIINFDEYIAELLEIICRSDDVTSWLNENNGIHIVNLSDDEHENFIDLIEQYTQFEKEDNKILSFSVFCKIVDFLKTAFNKPSKTEYLSEDISIPDKVMRIIEHSFKTITVSEIADKLFVNIDYINRLFKDETGNTVNQYLIMRKLAESKKYIYLGKSIKEACILSGFRDYSNFIRTFKKYEGCSPSELAELTKPI